MGGFPAPVGTVVTAKVGGVECGSITTTVAGQYGGSGAFNEKLTVSGDIKTGATYGGILRLPNPTAQIPDITWERLNKGLDEGTTLQALEITGGNILRAIDRDKVWTYTDAMAADLLWDEHTIAGSFDGARSVYATDVDGDGDIDVLGAADIADDISWWENDGSESFTKHTVAGSFAGANHVYATDVDGDGDIDVLGAASDADDITWWENDGNESFTKHTIADSFDGPRSVYATDVDLDGDVDVLGAAFYAHDITWWE